MNTALFSSLFWHRIAEVFIKWTDPPGSNIENETVTMSGGVLVMCRHSWPGIACGFALFILVFIYDKLSGASICVLGKARTKPAAVYRTGPGRRAAVALRFAA
jgi:hypothetical protein